VFALQGAKMVPEWGTLRFDNFLKVVKSLLAKTKAPTIQWPGLFN